MNFNTVPQSVELGLRTHLGKVDVSPAGYVLLRLLTLPSSSKGLRAFVLGKDD